MPTIRITTGRQFAEHEPPVTFEVETQLTEFSPELVFHACNRRDYARIDIAETLESFGRDLAADDPGYVTLRDAIESMRLGLDEHHASSMSSQDTFTIISDAGERVVTYVCEPSGWSTS